MEAVAVALLVLFPLLGATVRRWGLVVLPLVGWPLFYLGLSERWWGYGLGDTWEEPAAGLTIVGVTSTTAAVVVGRAFAKSRSRRAEG